MHYFNFVLKITLYPEGSKEVFNHVPIEIMPTEMGGNGKSHYEYCGNRNFNYYFLQTAIVRRKQSRIPIPFNRY